MKPLRLFCLAALASLWLVSVALAQTPAITGITIKDTGCIYNVGKTTTACSIAPGMTLIVRGSNFGAVGGGVVLCDCPPATIVTWTGTRIVATVNAVTPSATVALETAGGSYSNAVSYTALGPVITSIVVGNCTYIPSQTPNLCLITPGTQITINGSYFGPQTIYSEVRTCNCAAATIVSWDPNWLTKPSPYNNQIVATANEAVCGNTVAILADTMWSNYIPYTAC